MNITRFFVVVFASLFAVYGCEKGNQFTINGKITHAEGEKIYLEELLLSRTKMVDSAKINSRGEFKIKGGTSIPTFYLLKFSPEKFITLLIDSAEDVTVQADFANFSSQYDVEGSSGSSLVKQLVDKLNATKQRLDSLGSLNNLYQGAPGYERMQTTWKQQYDSIVKEQTDFSTNFVMKNPFSMASVLALYQQFGPQDYVIKDLQTMRVAASALNSIYPGSEQVRALYNNTLEILKDEKAAKVQKFIQENGENSPDIVLPDPSGKDIALSSLRGKVVLLQFWAAVDRNSRIQNPVLVEAYEKYKNKGFDIYQVSVDDNRIEWVDAIDKDGLKWTNVGDMKGSNVAVQMYNIKVVPYNYLLDREGRIVAQNLKGPELDRTLSGIFK